MPTNKCKNGKQSGKVGKGRPPKEHQFSSTNQPANRGRKKLVTTIAKEDGYSAEEVKRVMAYLLTLTKKEMEELKGNEPDGLTLICLRAIEKAAAKGEYHKAKEIIDHVAGKPMQRQEHTGKDGGPIEFSDLTEEELEKKIKSLGGIGGSK